jgi:DNA repair photolyase
MRNIDSWNDRDADILIGQVDPKFKPVFENPYWSNKDKRSIYRYLFSRKPKKLPPSLKSRLIGLYDPLADRSIRFMDGLRWCLNVYVGCEHNCGYCYVNGYSQESVGSSYHPKKGFEKILKKDISELKSLGVPAVPLHMSNSTDPFQEKLERKYRHAMLALGIIHENRQLFSSVVLLTKNPRMLCMDEYRQLITDPAIQPFTIQVSCAFWNDSARNFYEPNAPNIKSRLAAIEKLAFLGLDVEVRIDPLFPSASVSESVRFHKPLSQYSIPEAQSLEDLQNLVCFASKAGVRAVIAKPLKIPITSKAQRCKDWFGEIYRDSDAGKKRLIRGGSWRLPEQYQKEMLSTVSGLCQSEGIQFRHCMHDVLMRR